MWRSRLDPRIEVAAGEIQEAWQENRSSPCRPAEESDAGEIAGMTLQDHNEELSDETDAVKTHACLNARYQFPLTKLYTPPREGALA